MSYTSTLRAVALGIAAWVGTGPMAQAQTGSKSPEARPALRTALAHKPLPTAAQRHTQANIAAQRTNPNSRLGGDLQRLATHASRAGSTRDSLRAAFPQLRFSTDASAVLVRITAEDVNALLPSLLSRGFVVVAAYPTLHFVEGMLPVSQLAPSAGLDGLHSRGLLGVLPSRQPHLRSGVVTSQADYILEAARTRATRPNLLDGKGVRVGVLSDSYNSLQGAAAGVASGDLPAAGVQVLQDLSPGIGTDEGRAMAELVHDLAPGSPLAFSSAYYGEGDFANQIRYLADPAKGNCTVLVDDIGYSDEPFYQDGVIAQAVNEVVAQRGVTYFSAAGNYGSQSYENNAPTFVSATIGTKTAARLNFNTAGTTTDVTQRVVLHDTDDFSPILQWSDPYYTTSGVKTDLDMYLIAVKNGVATTDTVASSNDSNKLTFTPIEGFQFTNDSSTTGTNQFDLVIVRRAGTANPSRLKYIDESAYGAGPTEWLTNSGTVVGHAAAASAQAVAACPFYNQRVADSYSSRGGTIAILFSDTGTALSSAQSRAKPDISSIDGVDTSFFGEDIDGNGYLNFSGTSAAAPQAAAVAALLRQSEPTLTAAQVYARLASTARDIGTTGFDNVTGAGLVDAYTAVYGAVAAASAPAVEDLEKAALPLSWTVNSTVAGRVQVITALNPASGAEHLLLDSGLDAKYTNYKSLNEVTWYLTGITPSSAQLTFRHRKLAAETDEVVSRTAYTGSTTGDGVSMSVDGGTTWYRIYDLTGTNSSTTYQTATVNLTQFAATNGLTLGTSVRIKFQQYGVGLGTGATDATRHGRVFDDIAITAVNSGPIPLYTATPRVGCPGQVVAFADTSALRPTSRVWTFVGGTPSTSTAANPTVTYATAGHFPVTLSVTNANGTVARTDTGVVFIYGRAPLATAAATRGSICPGSSTVFSSTITYCASTYAWTFPGGSPATSAVQNPGAVTYATAGNYVATLTVSNAYGSATSTVAVEVTSGRAIPFAETFDAALTIPTGWTIVNPDGLFTWAVVDTIGRSGQLTNVLRAPFYFDSNVGEHDAVYTPALNLASATKATLLFDLAYAPYSTGATYVDSLSVQIAEACSGTILGRPYAKGSTSGLATATGRTTLFKPRTAADWRQESVDLTPYVGKSIVVRFVGRNGHGNALYLDNVQVGGTLLALTAAASTVGLEAWPNPVPTGTSLHLRLPAYTGSVGLRLVDNLGRTVWQDQVQQTGASLERTLSLTAATGIYSLLYTPAAGTPAALRIALE